MLLEEFISLCFYAVFEALHHIFCPEVVWLVSCRDQRKKELSPLPKNQYFNYIHTMNTANENKDMPMQNMLLFCKRLSCRNDPCATPVSWVKSVRHSNWGTRGHFYSQKRIKLKWCIARQRYSCMLLLKLTKATIYTVLSVKILTLWIIYRYRCMTPCRKWLVAGMLQPQSK